MKPVIAINVDVAVGPPARYTIHKTYITSVIETGGIPILLPPLADDDLAELLDRVHGVVLIGGDDYSPSLYGEEPAPTTKLVEPEREIFDLRLMAHLNQRPAMPVLGICGGCQLMNVALGGSLIQDVTVENLVPAVKHAGAAGWKVQDWHEVEIDNESRLFTIYKKRRLNVPTAHRQAVRRLGDGLRGCARTDDGVIEAIEMSDRNFAIGVQWHPERDVDGNRPLFSEFLLSAKSRQIRE